MRKVYQTSKTETDPSRLTKKINKNLLRFRKAVKEITNELIGKTDLQKVKWLNNYKPLDQHYRFAKKQIMVMIDMKDKSKKKKDVK